MTQSIRSALEHEVARFKSWAETFPYKGMFGEWECEYPYWASIYEAVSDFLSNTQIGEWDQSVVDLLIYAIARDNEAEFLADLLQEHVDKLRFIAKAAVQSEEDDAKWQLCERLAQSAEQIESAESLILPFASDQNEYVRQRALLALGKIKPNHAEILAEKAWETGNEYQRIAALYVLYQVQSERLETYLIMALADGRQYLTAYAERILRGEPVD